MPFTVAIVGRPNVGKSTLFNRLTGRKSALVDATPGVTRDRREGRASLGGSDFTVIDTAGYEEGDPESLHGRMWLQTQAALRDADCALLLIDARAGITPMDAEFAQRLRMSELRVILVANKCEGKASDAGYYDAFALGLGEPVPISSEHGLGFADLHDALVEQTAHVPNNDLAASEAADAGDSSPLRLAIIGRPNVGKSTLINRLVGEERLITGPEPGLTRDAIAVEWEICGRRVQLIDTAGLRRKAKVTKQLEKMSAADTRRATARAHVVVVVLDAAEPMARADLSAANLAIEEGRALVVALNKWDQVTNPADTLDGLDDRLRTSLPQVRGVPVVSFSALNGNNVEALMPVVLQAHGRWNTRISTGLLNRWLAGVVERQPPPGAQGRRNRLRYATQASARPPTFVLFASRPEALPAAWVRFAVNDLREAFGLRGVPIRMNVRKSRNNQAA